MKPELISYDLCPYVQRSVITLREKNVDVEITYIDLAAPPDWFLRISPFGKVPVLRVGDTVLFESAVINEYLDEIHGPSMHPADPLRKAHNRAWIEFGSSLLGDQYGLYSAQSEEAFERSHHAIVRKLAQLEGQLAGAAPYFNGTDYALIDAAYAPLFQRFALLDEWHALELYEDTPRVDLWQRALLARPSTKASVPADFATRYRAYIRNTGGYAGRLFGG